MATLCAISGELPQVPVVSRKSGNVYEKRLIETYISENGTEPTTGAPLTAEDLLDIQGSHTVRPRPPELTSIPSLLGAFQQEWDSLALEVFTLQQNLAQARQELSTALYQNDAAVRVIARLTQERDAAREALKNINISTGSNQVQSTDGDAMHLDSAPLPENIIAKIESTQAGLMKTRRKRPVPAEWAVADTISLFKPVTTLETPCAEATFINVRKSDNTALIGGQQGGVYTVEPSSGAINTIISGTEPATAGIWAGSRIAIANSTGKVTIIEQDQEVASFHAHSGTISGVALHPTGDILASVSADKSYALYDLDSNRLLTQVHTSTELTCTAFHPDGHLLAAGGKDGRLQIFDVKTGQLGGAYDLGGPATAICFSENGTWLATATEGSSSVCVWDLRKLGPEGLIHTLETVDVVSSLDWDYTAQFLVIGGRSGVTVKQYSKSTKLWTEPLRVAVPSASAAWGDSAQSILALNGGGAVTVLSSV